MRNWLVRLGLAVAVTGMAIVNAAPPAGQPGVAQSQAVPKFIGKTADGVPGWYIVKFVEGAIPTENLASSVERLSAELAAVYRTTRVYRVSTGRRPGFYAQMSEAEARVLSWTPAFDSSSRTQSCVQELSRVRLRGTWIASINQRV